MITGHVRVYQYDATKAAAVTDQSSNIFGPIGWNRVGGDIDGEAAYYDYSGWSVSLSSDGTILAIGAPYNDGNSSNTTQVMCVYINTMQLKQPQILTNQVLLLDLYGID